MNKSHERKRRHFSDDQKAAIVRRHLGDKVPADGGDPFVPREVYAEGRSIEIPRWQTWAKAAKAKLESQQAQFQ